MIKKIQIFIMTEDHGEIEVGGHGCYTQADADAYGDMLTSFGQKHRIVVKELDET
jgi:hypothetical protein